MHFIIYQITNKVNSKIYVGAHCTEDLDDGYMGSGTAIKRAIKKYGVDNFTKEILHKCETVEEMFAKEREIVTVEFVERDDTYNIAVGGHGATSHDAIRLRKQYQEKRASDPEFDKKMKEKELRSIRKANEVVRQKLQEDPEYAERMKNNGRHASKKLVEKIASDPAFAQEHRERAQIVVLKAQEAHLGSKWMVNKETNQELSVHRDEVDLFLAKGWEIGRSEKPNKKSNSEKLIGRKRMYNPTTNESKMVLAEEIDKHLCEGYIFGMKLETKRPRPSVTNKE